MTIEELNYKEARELILQPGKGRFQLLDKILLHKEIMAESVSVLLHRVCSRLSLRKEEVSYIGFYNWVRNYRSKEKANMEGNGALVKSLTSATQTEADSSAGFSFSDPATIKNNQASTSSIKFL